MSWFRRRPPAPEGIRLSVDGVELPVELVYDGRVNGLHQWTATTTAHLTPGAHIELVGAVIPARTAIVFPGTITFDRGDEP